jgi:hypothetical protein
MTARHALDAEKVAIAKVFDPRVVQGPHRAAELPFCSQIALAAPGGQAARVGDGRRTQYLYSASCCTSSLVSATLACRLPLTSFSNETLPGSTV